MQAAASTSAKPGVRNRFGPGAAKIGKQNPNWIGGIVSSSNVLSF
jgi:hypothetical protein